MVQACSGWVVAGVKVIQLYIPHVAHQVNEAVRSVCGDGHGTPIVADKEAKGMPLARVNPSLKSITHCLEVNLYVSNKVWNLVWSVQVGLDPVDNEPQIDICDPLTLAICLEDQEDGSSPTELCSAL